jgi:hypothetical protein
MNIKLITAAIAVLGLAACTPDITPQASSAPAQPTAEQQVVQAPQLAAAPAANEEKRVEGVASAEAKADDGGKKDD